MADRWRAIRPFVACGELPREITTRILSEYLRGVCTCTREISKRIFPTAEVFSRFNQEIALAGDVCFCCRGATLVVPVDGILEEFRHHYDHEFCECTRGVWLPSGIAPPAGCICGQAPRLAEISLMDGHIGIYKFIRGTRLCRWCIREYIGGEG